MKKKIYLVIWIIFAVSFLGKPNITTFFGMGIFLILWMVARSKAKDAKPAKAEKPAKQGKVNKAKAEIFRAPKTSEPAKERTIAPDRQSKADDQIDELATRLRTLATDFEDLTKEFFLTQQYLTMIKVTNSTRTVANAALLIGRRGIYIQYLSQNSRTGKPQEIKKSWRQVMITSRENYMIQFDNSAGVGFRTQKEEDRLFFDIAWQALGLTEGGGYHHWDDPKLSGVGQKLRDVARHLQDNKGRRSLPQNFDISGVASSALPDEKYEFELDRPSLEKPPATGANIAGYDLGAKLGDSSGFGNVYKAKYFRVSGEVAAVKVMQLRKGIKVDTPEFAHDVDAFLGEAKLSINYSRIPFLVAAEDYGIDPWPWIRYPLLEGHTIGKKGSITGDAWWNLAHDLLAGLSALHDDGTMHLDIKPDNVMITDECARILDLGLSRVNGYIKSDATGGFTKYAAAPEQLSARSLQDMSIAVDIYSAGVTLYIARTGITPYATSRESSKAEEIAARRELHFDASKFTREEMALLSEMLRFDSDERITARQALEVIAPHVDVESKTRLFEEILLKDLKHKAEEDIENEASREESQVLGPFKSWSPIEQALISTVKKKKPRYLIVQFFGPNGKESVYVQAYKERVGWHLETVSEKFIPRSLQTPSQRQAIIDLGWQPPTKQLPNYSRALDADSATAMVAYFIDAFERGYGLTPSQISGFKIVTQGGVNNGR